MERDRVVTVRLRNGFFTEVDDHCRKNKIAKAELVRHLLREYMKINSTGGGIEKEKE